MQGIDPTSEESITLVPPSVESSFTLRPLTCPRVERYTVSAPRTQPAVDTDTWGGVVFPGELQDDETCDVPCGDFADYRLKPHKT